MAKLFAIHTVEDLDSIEGHRTSKRQSLPQLKIGTVSRIPDRQAFNLPDRAMVQFTTDRKLVHANPAGHSELRDGHILSLSNGHVLAANPENDRMIAQAIFARQTLTLLVLSTLDNEFVALRLDFEADVVQCTMRRSGYLSGRLNLEIGAISSLTKAERRILGFIVENLTMEEIANKVGNSIETVRTHRKRIYAKMGVQSRADLLTIFVRALTK
jgi:DNA-binding CsgD family transcriptional regulator